MAKPETYSKPDAVEIKCECDYTVKAGTGGNDEDVHFEKGKTYKVSPRTATHMLRKTYRVFGESPDGRSRGLYKGDAPVFIRAEKKAAKTAAKAG